MIRRFFAVLVFVGGSLALAPAVADAQELNACFEMCHGGAMYLYEETGSLSFASVWFDGCMDTHCAS